ncbi:MAG: cation transporter [Elusimicrobia bacterium RIFOXYA2_FULL_39_19]|nr:MAG: cation transporter [Elusimicrobia bacterium RIFOXYA2_FULL_39_19]
MVMTGLFIILLIVLLGPFFIKKIEHNLEVFLFVMGLASCLVSGMLSLHLVEEALIEPIKITLAVFFAGIVFRYTRHYLHKGVAKILKTMPVWLFVFLMVVILGLVSSMITAIIAALVLVEIISALNLDKKTEIDFTIIACFSIGLGAALTPIGEPLSTILIAKLKSLPHVGFWYIFEIAGWYIIPGVFTLGIVSMFFHGKKSSHSLHVNEHDDTFKEITIRALKVYLFVMALLFLGSGFKPVIDTYIITLDSRILYWVNMTSAVLDNATLAAAEISPAMTVKQIQGALMGLLISGGMLIPGNIPNIIAANKLKITSRDWAKVGLPLGLMLMMVYFLILYVL